MSDENEKENKDNTGLHRSVYYSGSRSGRGL